MEFLEYGSANDIVYNAVDNILGQLAVNYELSGAEQEMIRNRLIVYGTKYASNKDGIYDKIADATERYFTQAEMEEILRFYKSPVAIKMLRRDSPLVFEIQEISRIQGGPLIDDLISETGRIVKDHGFEKRTARDSEVK